MLNVSVKGHRVHSNYTLGTSAQVIASANANRKTLLIQNQGSETVFIGPFGVSGSGASRGFALAAGNTFTDDGSNEEWWGLASSSSAVIHVIEVR